MGVRLASYYSILERSSTSSCNLASSSHQGLLRHALQVRRGSGGNTRHMFCSGHQGRLSCRGVGCQRLRDVVGSLQVGGLSSRGGLAQVASAFLH